MHAAIKRALALVVARETTLESRAGLVVEAFLRYAISTAHVLGVLATIAARFDLDGAWLAITGMASVLARVYTAVEFLAASVTARGATLMKGR